jgi:hypothetical protein
MAFPFSYTKSLTQGNHMAKGKKKSTRADRAAAKVGKVRKGGLPKGTFGGKGTAGNITAKPKGGGGS